MNFSNAFFISINESKLQYFSYSVIIPLFSKPHIQNIYPVYFLSVDCFVGIGLSISDVGNAPILNPSGVRNIPTLHPSSKTKGRHG
jgi:hypothetical protein